MSPLLDLPGELRNRIYGFAVSSCQEAPPRLRSVSRGPFPANRPKSWCELQRAFLGLTQTCRQLRSEFLPIHQTQVKVCVDITDIEYYCSSILAHHRFGNVVIGHDSTWDIMETRIDIRELILLASRCHDVKVNFDTGVLPEGLDEMPLPRVDAYDQFLRYVAERTHKIGFGAVRYSGGGPKGWRDEIDYLLVLVKDQYAEDWMSQGVSLPMEEWWEFNPPEKDRPLIWPYVWGPLEEEHQKGCDWSDKLCDWQLQLGLPVGMSVVPVACKHYVYE